MPSLHFIRRTALALCLSAATAAATVQMTVQAAAPRRVVSLNLCTDQLLLALAEPSQIVALSAFARNAEMSFFAADASAYPIIGGSAEEVMSFQPDLVLAGLFTKRDTRELLRRFGYRLVELPPADSFAQIHAQYRETAEILGAPGRAVAALDAFDRALATSPDAALTAAESRPTALYYQRRGFASGAGTLMDEVIRAAGLRNLAAALGYDSVVRIPLEQVVAARPDFLIVDAASLRTVDRGSELLDHPALARAVPHARWIPVAQAFTACGGPWIAAVITDLRARAAASPISAR